MTFTRTELEKQLSEFEQDYKELNEINAEKEQELQQAISDKQNAEEIMRSINFKLNRINRNIGNIHIKLHKLELEEKEERRLQEIKNLREQYPTFINLIEHRLSEIEANQKEGKKHPLEVEINAIKAKERIEQLDSIEYVQNFGFTNAYQVFRDKKQAYEYQIQADIEQSFENESFSKSFEDFESVAIDLINDISIKEYLGNDNVR